jgi:hypothetical protein
VVAVDMLGVSYREAAEFMRARNGHDQQPAMVGGRTSPVSNDRDAAVGERSIKSGYSTIAGTAPTSGRSGRPAGASYERVSRFSRFRSACVLARDRFVLSFEQRAARRAEGPLGRHGRPIAWAPGDGAL